MKSRTSLLLGLAMYVGCSSLLSPAVRAAEPSTTSEHPVITLAASEQKSVGQDQLNSSLRIEIEDKDARLAQDAINKAMSKALELSKAYPKVKVSTGAYYVYQYDPNPSPRPLSHAEQMKRMIWKASQTIDLQSKDSAGLLELSGKMQDAGFLMNGMTYSLSSDAEEMQKDELLVGALQKIQKKAELVAKTLGKSGYDIVEVNIEGANMPAPQPMMMKAERMDMAVASAAPVAAPVAAPGETTVSLSVSARVALK